MDIEKNENNISFDNITRCPECNLISSLKLYYKGKPFIDYYCENNHKGKILLEEYMKKYNNYSLLKEKCQDCNKNQNEVKGEYLYCSKCNKFLCYLCIVNHLENKKHNIINLKRYDSLCKIHSNFFIGYCRKCKKNICIYCKLNHESHDLIDLYKFNYIGGSKKELEIRIKNIEKKIEDLDIIKQNISIEIDKLKKTSEIEIKYFKLLIKTYQYEEIQNNLNYNVIQNLINFDEIFTINKSNIYEKIYKEGTKYISFLQNIYQNIDQTNLIKNNFKTLNNHTSNIYHLTKLKDGRLASCSNDYSINIYNRYSFELQLSIQEHSNYIAFFTQLNNNKIITCSGDKTMNIIRLINDYKYEVEQKLLGHSREVWKVIEIRENELISVSEDRTMKKWEIKDDEYECTKTIIFQNSFSNCNILKLNNNEFVTSSYIDKCLKFWNSYDYSNISKINNVEADWTSGTLCMINNDILCVGGMNSKGFYLIKISNHQIIKNILGPSEIYCIYKCTDGLILCSIRNKNGNCALIKYRYENENMEIIVKKEKIHDGNIYTCIELNDGTIVSGGDDTLIKLWRN